LAVAKSPSIATRLKELRTAAGMTQAELAAKAGLSLQGLWQIESGRRDPSWSTVVKLAKALNVSLASFDSLLDDRSHGADADAERPASPIISKRK
jgi:putative transcriptional regulator